MATHCPHPSAIRSKALEFVGSSDIVSNEQGSNAVSGPLVGGEPLSDDIEMQQRRLRLKNAITDLQVMRGGWVPELVTVIIPSPDKQISDVRGQLSQELGQAQKY